MYSLGRLLGDGISAKVFEAEARIGAGRGSAENRSIGIAIEILGPLGAAGLG